MVFFYLTLINIYGLAEYKYAKQLGLIYTDLIVNFLFGEIDVFVTILYTLPKVLQ